MSTTLQQPGMDNRSGYVDSHDFISLKLAKTRATIKTTEVLTSLMGVLALVVGYLFLFVLADHWLVPQGIGFVPRLVLLGGLLATTGVWLTYKVIIPYVKNVHSLYAAKVLETSEPEFRGNLLNLVDLQRSGRTISPHILSALEKRAAVKLADLNVEQAVDNRMMLRTSYALLALVVVSCLYTVFSPKPISPSIWAALVPTRDRQVATRTEISAVTPGDAEILARSQFEVTADILGELPEKVTLNYTTADRRHVDEPIRMYPVEEGLRSYRGIITGENGKGILQNFTYSIAAGDAVSPEFTVTVKQPPSATVESVRYKYPRYMALDQKTETGGHIDAWEGTTVTVRATASKPVVSATLQFIDNETSAAKAEEIAMEIADGTKLSLEWPLSIRSDGTTPKFYRIQCRDDQNNVDPAPTLYTLNVRPDLPPEVTLHDPTQDLELPANATVPLAITAQDPDFMLRYVILRVEKEGEPIWEEPLMEGQPRQDFQGFHDFKLAPLNLQPGEVISFWIEAHDNKEPVANRRSTPTLNIAIQEPVSEEEAEKLLEQQKQDQQEKLEQQNDENQQGQEGQEAGEPQQSENGENSGEQQEPAQEGEPQNQENTEDGESQEATSGGEQGNEGEPQNGDQEGSKPTAAEPQENENDEPKNDQQKKNSEGLDSDGSDDEEALRRLLQRQDEKKNEPEQNQDEQPGEQQEQGDEQPGDNPQDDAAGDQPVGDEPNTGENTPEDGAGEKQEQNEGDANNPGDMPEENPQQEGDTNNGKPSKPDEDNKQNPQEGPTDDGEQEKVTNPLKEPTKSKDGEVKDGEVSEDEDPNADPGDKTTSKRSDSKDPKPGQPSNDPADPEGAQEQEGADENADPNQDPAAVKKQEMPDANMPPGDGTEEGQDNENAQEGDAKNSKPSDKGLKQKGSKSQNQNGQPGDSSESSDSDASDDPQEQNDDQGKPNDGKPDDKQMPDEKPEQKGEKKEGEQKQEGGEGGEQKNQEGAGGGEKGKGQGEGGPSGEPSDQPSSKGNKGGKRGATSSGGNTTGEAGPAGDADGPNGAGESPYELQDAEAANLEDKEKAVNLVLKQIEDQLKRGELDPELLKEMGWTEAEMKKFVERMQRQLQAPDAENATPADAAKRIQFEEMLKNIDTTGQARERKGVDVKKSAGQEIGPRRLDVPPEFKESFEAFTKSLSKYRNQPADNE